MQNTYDKKWFWGPWEYYVYLVIEIFYETTWKWTIYFKYINLWAFDVDLSLCHDIGDYPVCVTTSFVWRLCHVTLGEVSGFDMILDILMAHIDLYIVS